MVFVNALLGNDTQTLWEHTLSSGKPPCSLDSYSILMISSGLVERNAPMGNVPKEFIVIAAKIKSSNFFRLIFFSIIYSTSIIMFLLREVVCSLELHNKHRFIFLI